MLAIYSAGFAGSSTRTYTRPAALQKNQQCNSLESAVILRSNPKTANWTGRRGADRAADGSNCSRNAVICVTRIFALREYLETDTRRTRMSTEASAEFENRRIS